MAHLHRFYVSPETALAEEVALSPGEAHHALHVVRLRSGDSVQLFDGHGRTLTGTLRITGKRTAVVSVEHEQVVPPPSASLMLIQAWLNHEKVIDTIIRDCTALGVTEFRFFAARRSERAPRRPERWHDVAVESCKQSGRAWLPAFRSAGNLEEALAGAPQTRFIATKELAPAVFPASFTDGAAVVVGPEGDLTSEELELAQQHSAAPLSLGPATLRSELAATVACALLLHKLGAFSPDTGRARTVPS